MCLRRGEQHLKLERKDDQMSLLKSIVKSYMEKVSGLKEHCERCLRTERWGGSVVLMVMDARLSV